MSKPLIVYLDSSDYSIFSDDSKRSPEIIKIESQLLKLRDENKIELRFSHINVIEAAPTKPEDKLSSLKRLQTIKKFCGQKCLASYVLILENEIEFLRKQKTISVQFNVLNENGIWFPDFADIKEFSCIAEDIKEEISKIPDRKKRRIAERKFFNANGSVKNASAFLKGSAESFAENICSKYPILEKDAKLAAESYFRNGSMTKFIQSFSKSLSNLEILSDWYALSWDDATQLSSFLREIGEDLLISLGQLRDKSIELTNHYKLEGLNDTQIKNKMNESFDGLLNSLPNSILNRLNKNHASISNQVNWNLCPSLFTITTLSVHLAKLNSLTKRKPKTSDLGDILHASYLPYVDIFRADANTTSIIEQAKLPFKTRVVSKLIDLPSDIENLLKLKSNNCIND